jgi:uncharacterized repeat protein (TIGR02543 family)
VSFGGPDYSTVLELDAPELGFNYSLTPGSAYLPAAPLWSYEATPSSEFFSTHISGVQRLPNGNTLIDEGATGTLFEVTLAGQMVWKYVNPTTNGGVLNWDEVAGPQGPGFANSLFRVTRYPTSHPAFAGKDLTPTAALEVWDSWSELTLQSTGGGSVVSRPEASYSYGVGQLVTLIAETEDGFVFTGWTVEAGAAVLADALAPHTSFSMGVPDTTVQANFTSVAPIPTLPRWGVPLFALSLAACAATALERRSRPR